MFPSWLHSEPKRELRPDQIKQRADLLVPQNDLASVLYDRLSASKIPQPWQSWRCILGEMLAELGGLVRLEGCSSCRGPHLGARTCLQTLACCHQRLVDNRTWTIFPSKMLQGATFFQNALKTKQSKSRIYLVSNAMRPRPELFWLLSDPKLWMLVLGWK